MAMASAEAYPTEDKMEVIVKGAVLEEIDEDENSLMYGKPESPPVTPEPVQPPEEEEVVEEDDDQLLESPVKTRRAFGNISPISELLDDDDLDVASPEKEEDCESAAGKVTPEPNRSSFPRLSDGRSSPILAYSPSLIKSPSSNNSKSRIAVSSPSSGGSGGIGKRPRNIARMLDNISDHSSGEEEVNNVGMMMAKFTV